MKALVLSCNTGRGHFAAAAAIAEEFKMRGIPCEHRDVLDFADRGNVPRIVKGPIKSDVYGKVVTTHPAVFRVAYSIGDKISSPNRRSPIYYANSTYADNLGSYMESKGVDTVVCTHMFTAEAVTVLQTRGYQMRAYAVATDYLCLPFWEECAMVRYVVPHADVIDEFASHGIPRDKIVALGLPVAHAFRASLPTGEARKRLGLPGEGTCYLIMSGSMGFGGTEGIEGLPASLLALDCDSCAVVVCGNNAALAERMEALYKGRADCRVLGFTDDIPAYCDACDVVLTKPGGLSSTEVASKGKPIVHTPAIPGFERRNAVFFSEHGMSLLADDYETAARYAFGLAHDEGARERMVSAQRANVDAYASQRICDRVVQDEAEGVKPPSIPTYRTGVMF